MKLIILFLISHLYLLKHISEEGFKLIKEFEGFRDACNSISNAYKGLKMTKEGFKPLKESKGYRVTCYSDIESIESIGTLPTSNVQKITGIKLYKGLKITKQLAEELLFKTIRYQYERYVNKYDKYYTFTQSQFDALVSFTYNLGEKNLSTLLQNGARTKSEISDKLLEFSNIYNSTSMNYERSEALYKRRLKEKELFDREPSNSGIVHIINDIYSYSLSLGSITVKLVEQNQIGRKSDEEEDMNIIYYDLNGNSYRTKCKYENYLSPSETHIINCINTESIQQRGNIYIKLNKNTKISNGDIISTFDSNNFKSYKYAEFKIIDSFAKLQITYFYKLYYLYYSVYIYGTYFSYFFRLSTKLKDEDFPRNFKIRIYIIFAFSTTKTEELDCQSDKLSMLENDFDYEYIIRCSGYSSGVIYENRSGQNYLQFRAFYQPVSATAYNPLIMSANPTNINSTNPLSVIKIQKYEISYNIIKSIDELNNFDITFNGIYIKDRPQNIINGYFDYGIYFITNNNEKLNTKCQINILGNNEVKLKCRINTKNQENILDLRDGIYNSYIFICKLDIDYVFNYRQTNMVILERFALDIGGTIVLSRIDDNTTIDDLKININEKSEDKNNDENIKDDDNRKLDNNEEENKNNEENQNDREKEKNNNILIENLGEKIWLNKLLIILIYLYF